MKTLAFLVEWYSSNIGHEQGRHFGVKLLILQGDPWTFVEVGCLIWGYRSNTKVANTNWWNSEKEGQAWKQKTISSTSATKENLLKIQLEDFDIGHVLFCTKGPCVYVMELLSILSGLVDLLGIMLCGRKWLKFKFYVHILPNAYFILHYRIVSQWYIQLTITANPILHNLNVLHLKPPNFNLRNGAWWWLRWFASNESELGIVQYLQMSHDVNTRQRFC